MQTGAVQGLKEETDVRITVTLLCCAAHLAHMIPSHPEPSVANDVGFFSAAPFARYHGICDVSSVEQTCNEGSGVVRSLF